jgi:FixJ family two-component response regulator
MNLAQTLSREPDLHSIPHLKPIVFVVADDAAVRESLELLIRCEGWQPETFQSPREFLNRPRPVVPSCLVLDVSLPDLDGLELQKAIARERAEMPIILISDHGDVPTTVRAMKAGAADFLTKPFSNAGLLQVIRESLQRSRVVLDREMVIRDLRSCYASLTSRERQVMGLVVGGLLNKQVGAQLGISEITVKAHRGQVMQKMKANSFADLVRMASRLRPGSQPIHLA